MRARGSKLVCEMRASARLQYRHWQDDGETGELFCSSARAVRSANKALSLQRQQRRQRQPFQLPQTTDSRAIEPKVFYIAAAALAVHATICITRSNDNDARVAVIRRCAQAKVSGVLSDLDSADGQLPNL